MPAPSVHISIQLEYLTNERYNPGKHRVRLCPNSTISSSANNPIQYRYSVVFILRAHSLVLLDTDTLTTNITGVYLMYERPLKGMTAGDLFEKIHSSQSHINVDASESAEQREKMREKIENRSQVQGENALIAKFN